MTNECKDCAMGCCGCISLLALVAGSVAYYVFAIIALVNEYHEPFNTMCSCKSHLWIYMLVFIIYNLEFGRKLTDVVQDNKAGYVEKCIASSITGLIELGLIGSNWSFVAAYRSQSEMREEPGRGDIGEGLHADQFGVFDLTGTWRINQQWEAQVLLLNAFDEDAIVSHRPYGARPTKPLAAIGRIKYNF